MRAKKVPSYLHHRTSNRARVRIDGRDIWLGRYDSPESRERYDEVITQWKINQASPLPQPRDGVGVAVVELLAAYFDAIEFAYAGKGRKSHLLNLKSVLRTVRLQCGSLPVHKFGPLRLRQLQEYWISQDHCRKYVNAEVGMVKQVFRWGISVEMVPATVAAALDTVPALRRGHTQARESKGVQLVEPAIVEATLPFLPGVVADMVRIQRRTGARCGEICKMNPGDIDCQSHPDVWLYQPAKHKNTHRGHSRTIVLGPECQEIISKYLFREPCFRPCDATSNSRAGTRYTSLSYYKVVTRAAAKAGVPHWSPGQLRHLVATELRAAYGLETAQAVLGHKRLSMTQHYAQVNPQLAIDVAQKTG